MNLTKILSAVIGVILLSIMISTCTLVSPQEAGFKINKAGDYRGVENLPLVTGYNFYLPWVSEIKTIPTTMQHIVWSEDGAEGSEPNQQITVACSGGAGFKMDVGLNYHVSASDAPKIYLRWKETNLEEITNKFIRNITRGTMQDISGHITVDSILNNLPGYESNVRSLLSSRMKEMGFIVDNFNILKRPIPTDKLLEDAINAKIHARQHAERVQTELQSSVAEAEKRIAEARGDSASKVIRALGESAAIKAMREQVTPVYVDYLRAQKWDGALPSTILGSGSNTLFNLH